MLNKIINAVLNFEEDAIEGIVNEALSLGVPLEDILDQGLGVGMSLALEKYEAGEYDIPEVIVCADVLNRGVNILSGAGELNKNKKAKIVIAIVEGDTHEIGKNIVRIMLDASGYQVIDLGVNCKHEEILSEALKNNAQFIGLGSMMTTTRGHMKKLIEELDKMTIENKPLVIVGGGSITPSYAKEIGAFAFGGKAPDMVRIMDKALKNANEG